MALTRAQLLSGDNGQGIVLSGQVQGVKQGIGVIILPDGTINFDSTTATGVMRLNNSAAYNAYSWPALSGAPVAGAILQSEGTGALSWTVNYVPTTSPTGAANLPVGFNAQRPPFPIAGQIRYNAELDVLEYHNGTTWVSVVAIAPTPGPNPTIGFGLAVDGSAVKVSIATVSPSPTVSSLPAQAMDGSLYWDNALGLLFIYYNDGTSSQWVQVTPSGGGGGGGATGTFLSADTPAKTVTVVNGLITSIA